jgi:DNA repair/transcription protein MET18/MMS19
VDHLDFSDFVGDLFDVIFCYFPITFKAGPEDPLGLTIDDLKLRLRNAITATPLFAPLAIPVIIEKLSSDSWSAKVLTLNGSAMQWKLLLLL